MEPEEQTSPGKGFLLVLGVVGLLVGGLVAAELAVPLQPGLGGNNVVVQTGGAVVTMPSGVGSNLQSNFAPANITVYIGTNNTVTFENLDTATHTVTANDGSFDSGNMVAGAKWNYTFTAVGDFTYFCKYHGWMKGTVVVKQGGATVRMPAGLGANPSLNYQPAIFSVAIGANNTVTFTNLDTATHTITANGGSFDSGDILIGGSWTHTFSTVGTFVFHCKYHTWMTGTIIVTS